MTLTVYGTTWCTDCKRSKQFLGEQRVHYAFVDVDADAAGRAVVESHNDGKTIIPTITFDDGRVLVEPSNAELAAALGLTAVARRTFYDLIVVGAGPAGLTAALYAAREGLDTLVLERAAPGGQAGVTERLDNFPGFPEGVTGAEFADRLRAQAERFGVEVLPAVEVAEIVQDGMYRGVRTASGEEYRSHALLLALGSTYRRLDIPGEDDLIGAGVHFCATCDGPFYRDRPVAVIGGGNSAAEEALFLTRFASHVTVVAREALTASRVVIDKLQASEKVTVLTGWQPVALLGDGTLRAVALTATGADTATDAGGGEDTTTDAGGGAGTAARELAVDGAFVFIGLSPNTDLVAGLVDRDERGFLVTDMALQTSIPGVFAAGDARAGSTKQAASAAGEGAAVALAIRRYLEPLTAGATEPHPRVGAVPV